MCSLGIEPTTSCAADAMLYHRATGTHFHSTEKHKKHKMVHFEINLYFMKLNSIKLNYILMNDMQ